MTVFLCGFMGCGKSTVGVLLAKLLGVGFVDMDKYIEQKAGMTVAEIFESHGEEHFRKLEKDALGELCRKKAVIACGGGTLANPENIEMIKPRGRIIFIDTPFEDCYGRIRGDVSRPLAAANTKDEMRELFNARYEIYSKNADITVSASETSPLQCAKELCAALK